MHYWHGFERDRRGYRGRPCDLSLQSPMDGFTFVNNFFLTYYIDRLHASDKGLPENIMGMLQAACSDEELDAIREYVQSLPSYLAHKYPSQGLDKESPCTATETANLFKLLPVALLLIFRATQKMLMDPIQGTATPLQLHLLHFSSPPY